MKSQEQTSPSRRDRRVTGIEGDQPLKGDTARERLLAWMPVTERRLQLAGVSTAVLEGGDGLPVILLHGPVAYAAHWMRVIPDLVTTHRIIAPDLPGHGASAVITGELDQAQLHAWLGELIDATCPSPPVLVGQLFAGAMAARFAATSGNRLRGLVLVDSHGLSPFQPTAEFGQAIGEFMARPDASTHQDLWQYCAFDLPKMRQRMGERWQPFEDYNLDRARTPSVLAAVGALMHHFAMPAIPPDVLARIAVPTTLIWGRHDLGTPLSVAEAASSRYGWPLHVVDDAADDPAVEQPDAFLRALRIALSVR